MASMLLDSLPFTADASFSPFAARNSFASDFSTGTFSDEDLQFLERAGTASAPAPAPISAHTRASGIGSISSASASDDAVSGPVFEDDVFQPATIPPGQRLMTSYMTAEKPSGGRASKGGGMLKMGLGQQQVESSPAHSSSLLVAPQAPSASISPLTSFSGFPGSSASSVSLSPVGPTQQWTTSPAFQTPQSHGQYHQQSTPSYSLANGQQGGGPTPLLTSTPIAHPTTFASGYQAHVQTPMSMAYQPGYGYNMGYPSAGYMQSPLAQQGQVHAHGMGQDGAAATIYVPPPPPFPATKPGASTRKSKKAGSMSMSAPALPGQVTPHGQHTSIVPMPMHTPPVSAPPSFAYLGDASAGSLPPHMMASTGPSWRAGPDTPTPVRRRGRAGTKKSDMETPSRRAEEGQAMYGGTTFTPAYTPQSTYSQPLPLSPPGGHVDVFSAEANATGTFTPGGRRAASADILTEREHVRRRSAASSPGPVGEQDADAIAPARRARGLEIKRSKTEGRRLVFPDSSASPEPETMGHEHRTSLSQHSEPRTPPSQIARLRSPRTTTIPALTLGQDGTAAVGEQEALESDIAWLAPKVDAQESPAAIRKPGEGETTGTTPQTGSEKKRKRINAFRAANDGRRGKTTMVHGYGRVATGKSAALKFLGMDGEERVEAIEVFNSPRSNVYSTPTMGGRRTMPGSAGSSAPGPSTPRQPSLSSLSSGRDERIVSPFGSPAEPAWPDAVFPWAEETLKRQKQAVKVEAVVRMEKLAFVERYLDGLSDADSDDDVFVGRQGVKGVVVESDAIDALVQIKRGGAPVFDESVQDEIGSRRYLNESAMGPTLEDESGCICRGQNKEGGGMVCCDGCSGWFHMACFGIQGEEELGTSWFCWQCELKASPAFGREALSSTEQITSSPEMPMSARRGTFAPIDDSEPQNYHSHSGIGNTALAPSPVFSSSGRLPSISGPPDSAKDLDSMDTPRLSYNHTPRIPSTGTSRYGMLATPGTPLNAKSRIVSYAEHYNVCQTPGDTSHEYKKIYSTPKFEDFFDGPYGATPAGRNPTSPTPSRRKVSNRNHLAFTTPSTSQSFLQGLQSGNTATPGLEHLSSGGVQYSPFPASPSGTGPQNRAVAQISDISATPSPLRHRRQVSFNRTAYTATSSHLRDSIMIGDETAETTPKRGSLDLGGELDSLVQRKGKAGIAAGNPGLGFELEED